MKGLIKSGLKYASLIIIIPLLLFIFLEGMGSIIFSIIKINRADIVAERIHTEYDPMLGWINKPDLFIADMYGPGKYFQTNSQRFRNKKDFETKIPPMMSRWICCGDSFTLGYGVDNDNTWCAQLSSMAPNIETVNMGQGGYGIDQSYLWFMRDGTKLQYDLLIFAFITSDLSRAISSKFRNYSKPLLTENDGKIITENIPVPKPGIITRYIPKFEPALQSLRIIKLIHALLAKLQTETNGRIGSRDDAILRIEKLTTAIFNSLTNYNRENNRRVLFVYLPTQLEYRENTRTEHVRNFISNQAKENNWLFIDLFDDFRKLEPEVVSSLFLQRDLPGYKASKGHYTEKGNRYIASLILNKIAENPATCGLLRKNGKER